MSSRGFENVPPKYRRKAEAQLEVLGRTIQERREHLNLTQEQLAERLNISVAMVQYIEQQRRVPSLKVLLAACAALDLQFSLKPERK
ncbi:MAG: helix-turn-helix transcriptional regulator [Bdellovibrionaceae bacterium]|nr:helix-turn-helix transcriptional regulator [Pseudobdellovibrionaceae bacterium]